MAIRELTLDDFEVLAREMDARDDATYRESLLTAAQENHFAGCSNEQLVRMWRSGRNPSGRKLNEFEFRALCEAWNVAFKGRWPKDNVPVAGVSDRSEIKELPDTTIGMKEVERITGLHKSTIKRMVKSGDFPKPDKTSARRIGWKAEVVNDWRNSRPR